MEECEEDEGDEEEEAPRDILVGDGTEIWQRIYVLRESDPAKGGSSEVEGPGGVEQPRAPGLGHTVRVSAHPGHGHSEDGDTGTVDG